MVKSELKSFMRHIFQTFRLLPDRFTAVERGARDRGRSGDLVFFRHRAGDSRIGTQRTRTQSARNCIVKFQRVSRGVLSPYVP